MKSKNFLDFFPVPKFLDVPYAGIDICDEAVRFIQFGSGRNGLFIKQWGEQLLPSGMVEEGHINDIPGVIKILSEFRAKYGLKYVRAALPEEKVYLFTTEIPTVEENEIKSNIEFHFEENVPIPVQESIFEYTVLSKDNPDHTNVNVIVLPQKVVETYLSVFRGAGLVPIEFEVETKALAHATIRRGDKGTFVLINFGERQTGVSIVSEGVVRFSSTLGIGGEALTASIQKNFGITEEEAKRFKKEKNYTDNQANAEIWGYFSNSLSALKDEINKVIIYWQTHEDKNKKGEKKIDKIILCGENAALAGFDRYIAMSMKIPVEMGNVWTNAFSFDDYIPNVEFNDSLNFAVSAGLALPYRHYHV